MRRSLTAGILAVTAALLTGCAASPAAPTPTAPAQSKAEACATLKDGMLELFEAMESGPDAISDPQGSYERLHDVSDQFADNAEQVSNSEVQAVAEQVGSALSRLADARKVYADDPASADPEEMTAAADAVAEAFGELTTVCK